MKTCLVTLGALSLAACGLLAQTPTMTCEHQGNRNANNFCEIRESTVTASALSVNGQTNGGISIKGADRSDILVRAMVQSQGESDGEARATGAQVFVRTAGGTVQSDGPSGKSWSVSYEIFVPRTTPLTLSTHNGGISISSVESAIEFHAQNGGISLKDVGGNVHGDTVNGGISVTLSGNAWRGQGLDVSTSNGGVSVHLPQQYSAVLDTATVNGGMSVKGPNVVSLVRGDRHYSTTLGSGGAVIRIRTQNGGVSISQS
ncbi:MAG TPA: DUF4097 family beta strand repeat-containing protein [Bryobacteraceae bacterium]|nr:DUF4097 family beta strand repeat-containing protein [Bryobacteraceae bacterium]